MSRFTFSPGTEIRIDDVRYALVRSYDNDGVDTWMYERLSDRRSFSKPAAELQDLYARGLLVGGELAASNPTRLKHGIKEMAPKRRDLRSRRRAFLRAVDEVLETREGDGPPVRLAIALAMARAKTGEKWHKATYHRLRTIERLPNSSEKLGGHAHRRGRPRTPAGVRKVFNDVANRLLAEYQGVRRPGQKASLGLREVADVAAAALAEMNGNQGPGLPALVLPNQATLYRWWNEFPAFERTAAKHGITQARNRFRFSKGGERTQAAYDRVEYDETPLDFYFFDDVLGIPLGQGTLGWCIETFSHAPVGFYVGWTPASDLTISAAMRHACSLKSYVRTEYPDIQNPWAMGGLPRALRVDNSLSQLGSTVERMQLELDIEAEFTPVRMPWFKGQIEALHDTLRRCLLESVPGFNPFGRIDACDYAPKKHAVVGLRHFLYILHKWLCDLYLVQPIASAGKSPNQLHEIGTQRIQPALLDSIEQADLFFATVRKGRRLDHNAVVYEGIRYRDDSLAALRYRRGDVLDVQVRVNQTDLGYIYVLDRQTDAWIRAKADDDWSGYAGGLSTHVHALLRKEAKRLELKVDPEDLLKARASIAALIDRASLETQSFKGNQLIARATGIGTENIFGNLHPRGAIGPLTGPYAGRALNPFAEAPPVLRAASPRSVPSVRTDPAGAPRGAETPGPAAGEPVAVGGVPGRRRGIAHVVADRSLTGRTD